MRIAYVASSATTDAWTARGYEGALKIVDSRRPSYVENEDARAGAAYRHGWGVHFPTDNHVAVMVAAAAQVERLDLASYGLDLETGWEYDGDRYGWGPNADQVELARVRLLSEGVLAAARAAMPKTPLWITCMARKLYPYATWLAETEYVSVQLYGERDPLPTAVADWRLFVEQIEGTVAIPARPSTPLPVPSWAWDLYVWHIGGKHGPRPVAAPRRVPAWFWAWEEWRLAGRRRLHVVERAVPSLWAGQPNPRADGACLRFDAELMQPVDYR